MEVFTSPIVGAEQLDHALFPFPAPSPTRVPRTPGINLFSSSGQVSVWLLPRQVLVSRWILPKGVDNPKLWLSQSSFGRNMYKGSIERAK